jgi:hypothetical protein
MKNPVIGKFLGATMLVSVIHLNSFSQGPDTAALSEKPDTLKSGFQFGASALITNNGISLVPTFSLGDPAVIFNIYMGKRRFSFEPDLRFSLSAKPWSMLFWFRYKLVDEKKFRFIVGAHPALNFRTLPAVVNGDTIERIVTRRYVAGELSPNYLVRKNISIGIYYLYGRGIDKEAVRNTHFLTLNANISDIKLPLNLYMRFTPQLYYLLQNQADGLYVTSTVALARKRFPFSLLSIINKEINSNIVSEDFVWNICLVYAFSKIYVEK